MSNVNVRRTIENIRGNTTVYTAIVEVIVNAIQAIDAKRESNGVVRVRIERDAQAELDGSLPDIRSVVVEDNGIGFDETNRDSFDTLYSDLKLDEGGKGFGRFVCLKYFENLRIESDYLATGAVRHRAFKMGKGKDIIVDEQIQDSASTKTGSIVTLEWLKQGKTLEKKLDTIARLMVEKLLPYFITEGYKCPQIVLSESDGTDAIVLNDFIKNQISSVIQEIPFAKNSFILGTEDNEKCFKVRLFKIFYPKKRKESRVSCSS